MTTKNLMDAVLKIKDANSEEITVLYSKGDLKWDVTNNVQVVLDRGRLSELKKGAEAPVSGSFSRMYDKVIAKSTDPNPSVYEALTGTGAAAHWVSTSSFCGVYTCRLVFEVTDECEGKTETVTFEKCHFGKASFAEGEDVDTQSYEFIDFETEPTVAWS